MNDKEKIALLMKFTFNADFALKRDYIDALNYFKRSSGTNPEDLLRLYRSKIRYEAFKEFSSDIDKILFGR